MILNVIEAHHIRDYVVRLKFNNGEIKVVDLQETIFEDHRQIFKSLEDLDYFKNFKIKFNTITWANEADFAPEFLYDLGVAQGNKTLVKEAIES